MFAGLFLKGWFIVKGVEIVHAVYVNRDLFAVRHCLNGCFGTFPQKANVSSENRASNVFIVTFVFVETPLFQACSV